MIKAVTYLGRQERLDGTSFLLVNEVDTNSTVTFDEKKHYLIMPKRKQKDNHESKWSQKEDCENRKHAL